MSAPATQLQSPRRPKLAVYKLTSCDGCQLSLLELEDELLELCDAVELAFFKEATSTELPGPYDVALVEGSISTPKHLEEIRHIRASAKTLVAIGACATAGGIQALRNFASVRAFTELVYASPEHIETLAQSTADLGAREGRLSSCLAVRSTKRQLLEVLLGAFARS
jgi:sulfhydrogenase subunit delta